MGVPDKYNNPPQPPPVFTATKDSIVEDANQFIKTTRTLLDKIVADVSPEAATFENVTKPMAHDENKSALSTNIIGFYQYVSASEELRAASTDADKLMREFAIECNMREDVFKLADQVNSARPAAGLDPESDRLVDKDYKNFIKYGLTIPAGPDRDRFKEIKKRLSEIQIVFQKNLNEENGGLWFAPEELDGVPDDVIEGLEKKDGQLKLSFKYPDLFPSLKFAKRPEVRRKIFVSNENKCPENAPLFKEAVVLRDEAARLLGFPNHAAFRLQDKMAKTPEAVDKFLSDLRQRLTPGGAKEVGHLLELKKSDSEVHDIAFDGKYYLWDHRYYDRLMLEKEYSIDENSIAEYFPLQKCVASMLHIFEQIMGLAFVELGPVERARISPTGKAEDISWHEDVIIFSVWDDASEGDEFVGYLYLDLHPRRGKYGHAANFNLQPGFIQEDGSKRYPVTSLVCNFSKPTATKPSLLKHSEVVTLFHELGHGIHDLVARTTYSRFHGTNTVRDFVEAPSQMLENWCWTSKSLKELSSHYETGNPIPDDLIERLVATKHVNDALFNLRQLHFGIFDMTVHGPKSHSEIEDMEVGTVYNKLRAEISGLNGPEDQGEPSTWGNGQATFAHLVGGYDAGYYGYLYSLVFSVDMYHAAFSADPMDPVVGRKYRHSVLEKGGSREEMDSLVEFLGREPNAEAFYKELGIAK